MKRLPSFYQSFLLMALLAMSSTLWGQNDCNEFNVSETVLNQCEKPVSLLVLQYNAIANHFGLKDTLDYTCIHRQNQYAFRNKVVETATSNTLPDGSEELILETNQASVKITKKRDAQLNAINGINVRTISFLVVIDMGDHPGEVWKYANEKFVHYQTTSGRKNGFYEEKYCNGNTQLSGHYALVDTIMRDTVVIFNPDTYEEEIVITESYLHSKKTGTWKHYDQNGILVKEENY